MSPDVFKEGFLDKARLIGDEEVDPLVRHVLKGNFRGQPAGRMGYNFMLDLADRIVTTPSLCFVRDSTLNQQLEQLKRLEEAEAGDADVPKMSDYFAPMDAPDWVDPEKIELGSQLWRRNPLVMLAVLYSSSLPACYLIGRGIPALYDTAKLEDPRYLFQRIYETGLMLDSVMEKDGIRVVEDVPDGGGRPRRYLWGKGYVTAKKVRFLHSSMRYMLNRWAYDDEESEEEDTSTEAHVPSNVTETLASMTGYWNTDYYGAPINQEDMAYTLLTFSYLIPKGLEIWGCSPTLEEKEAFLHLWRVVGHMMGINDELTTDKWDEAERLFEGIKERQGFSSLQGRLLTKALLGFLAAYMPSNKKMSRGISAMMIIEQLGKKDAAELLPEEQMAEVEKFPYRQLYAVGCRALKLNLRIRTFAVRNLPLFGQFLESLLADATHGLMDSWRGEYERRPFYIPANSRSWKQRAGVTDEFRENLQSWRRRLFRNVGFAVALLGVSAFAFLAILPAWILDSTEGVVWAATVCVAACLGASYVVRIGVPAIVEDRPKLAVIEPEAHGKSEAKLAATTEPVS